MFAVFADAPELFVFYGADTVDLWILALVAVAAIPLLLWWIGWLVGRFRPAVGTLVHRGSCALLAGALGVQIVRWLDVGRPAVRPSLLVAGGVFAALTVWFSLARSRVLREWAMVLAAAGPAFAGLFLFTSAPARALSGAAESSDPIVPAWVSDDVAPLALLILDEFPTRSAMTDEMGLDESVVPNLAAFARDATWYRGHSTVAEQTTQALPALFSGRYTTSAKPDALWFDHPENLFRLLESTHALHVREAITQLCPPAMCPMTSSVARTGDGADPAWRLLLADARDVLGRRLWPWREPLPIGLQRFADTDGGIPSFDATGAVDFLDPVTKFFGVAPSAQPGRISGFLAEMEPATEGGRPPAHVLHMVLPHQPWVFAADGTDRGEVDRSFIGFEAGRVLDEPFAVAVGRDHHLSQVAYTDGLVGAFLGRLEELGLYEESTIVILSDHGISFVEDSDQRGVDDRNPGEVLPTPLLVKPPGQSAGRVVDGPVQLVDVLSMISEGVGVGVPWDTDSMPVGERDGMVRYLDEDGGGMESLDQADLEAAVEAEMARDRTPEELLGEAGLTPEQAEPVSGGEEIPVEVPLPGDLQVIAPGGADALGLFVDDELVAVGLAARSGKVVIPLPRELWGQSPADVRVVPVEAAAGD